MNLHLHLLGPALLLALSGQQRTPVLPQASSPQSVQTVPSPKLPALSPGACESRIPISSAPFSISAPGSYYLTNDLAVTSGTAIHISVDDVTVDLNGFCIRSTATVPSGAGIDMSNGLRNLTFRNGTIRGGVVHTGSGQYSGPGFAYGIQGSVVNARVSDLSVTGCLLNGIYLEGAVTVNSCTVSVVSGYGIVGSTVTDSIALDCGVYGIYAQQIANSRGASTKQGSIGVFAVKQAQNCDGSTGIGSVGLKAITAMNCSGDAGSGTGLSATNATNCQGTSNFGTGLSATTAQTCQGTSSSGTGLVATIAQNCVATSTGGWGMSVSKLAQNCMGTGFHGLHMGSQAAGGGVALNSFGVSTGVGLGILAHMTIGSYGQSQSGVGILSELANSCSGVGSPPVIANYKYDMP